MENNTSVKSYIHKLKDIRVLSGTFKNDDGVMQPYKTIQAVVLSDGQEEVLNLSGGSATKPAAFELSLKGADTIDANDAGYNNQNSNFLED